MKINFLYILFLIFCSGAANAREVIDDALRANFIYEVRDVRGSVGYIFGSSHVTPADQPMRLSQCVKNALLKSKTIVIETDDIATKIFVSKQKSIMPMEKVVPFLSKSVVKHINKNIFNIDSEEPNQRMIAMDGILLDEIIFSVASKKFNQNVEVMSYGLDAEVQMAAKFLEKKVDFLENPEDQYFFLNKIDPEIFAKKIANDIELLIHRSKYEVYAVQNKKLVAAITEGNESTILDIVHSQLGEFGELAYEKRNFSQASKILAKISDVASSPHFFALGGIHLAGERGVPALLKKEGLDVRKICE